MVHLGVVDCLQLGALLILLEDVLQVYQLS